VHEWLTLRAARCHASCHAPTIPSAAWATSLVETRHIVSSGERKARARGPPRVARMGGVTEVRQVHQDSRNDTGGAIRRRGDDSPSSCVLFAHSYCINIDPVELLQRLSSFTTRN